MTYRDDSTTGGNPPHDSLEAMSGAYALDALSDDERHDFETLLEESESTRREVTELRETALLLAHAAPPVMPSAALRASIMDAIVGLPQLPAQTTSDSASQTPAATPVAGGAGDDHEIARPGRHAVPEMEPSETETAARVLEPTGAARARWFTRPVAMLGVAAAAAALFFGGGALLSEVTGPSQQQEATASSIDEIYAAGDFQRTVADVSTGGTATLVWSNELKRSAVVLDGLTSLPGDKTYELWYIGADGAVPAGTFDTDTDSTVTKVLKGEMTPGATIGLTVEPAGGSEQPTSDPIMAVQSA
ncbi:anti-sigma factor domain-containing protein [Frigoribacterium sp. VKM Ac-2530]|uniref:anti-sigma factor n=1 Tax=Frigoribacterium sp. VKM Ac-2530 TaxID=2783822 RepID=UPI00188CFED3|nr:anti-sigma factor [Frigoribacterium sp. VKM Ac-2530]